MLGPVLGVAHGALEQMSVISPMVPVSSAMGMKTSGISMPRCRVLPSRQHLETDRLAGLEVDERLVIGDDLAGGDGAPDLAPRARPLLQLLVQAAIEEAVAAAALGLGPIHRHVGLAQRGLHRRRVALGHAARSVSPEPRAQVATPTLTPTWSDSAASGIGCEISCTMRRASRSGASLPTG